MARSTCWLALMLASQTGLATSEIVEASTVTNVVASSEVGWDVYNCGVGGCDPRLTTDGDDNTVPDSRWSCEPSLAESAGSGSVCEIQFDLGDTDLEVDYIMLYHALPLSTTMESTSTRSVDNLADDEHVHESDTQTISIPFEVWCTFCDSISDLTTPGLALGVGQRVNINAQAADLTLEFDLSNGQYINLSEVEIYVDVEDPESVVVAPVDDLYVVDAKTVTNVVASAGYWDLSSDAGCGVAGCVPALAIDGQDNTVAASRWSCAVEPDYVSNEEHRCSLGLTMDSEHTVSYIVIYFADSDTTTEVLSFTVTSQYYSGPDLPFETTPETALGTGQRFNLPRPEVDQIYITPTNVSSGQVIEISEVEVYVEVTDTSVPISAAVAWNDVLAGNLTTVTATASESLTNFPAEATTDGDDNTVAASRWSCDGTGDSGYCEIYFTFDDDFTVSYLELYMHESADATKAAVSLEVCSCAAYSYSSYYSCCAYTDNIITYETKPGTSLGEPERVNVVYPTTDVIGIRCSNLTAIGGTVSISEVNIYLQSPDASPTPAPFQSPAPTPAPYTPRELDDDLLEEYLDDDLLEQYLDDDLLEQYLDDDLLEQYLDDDLRDELFSDDGAGTHLSKGRFFCAAIAAVVMVVASSGSSGLF